MLRPIGFAPPESRPTADLPWPASAAPAIRQPTIFLDLALAPKETTVPDGDGLPDRTAAERFLVASALNPFLVEVAAQRSKETATIEKHLKISLNELIHRQNLRMAEIHEQGQFGDETLMAANMKKVEDKLDELNGRLEQRTAELRREATVTTRLIMVCCGRRWRRACPDCSSRSSRCSRIWIPARKSNLPVALPDHFVAITEMVWVWLPTILR